MRVRLLGPMEVDSGSGQPSPRDRVVLAALVVRRGQPLSQEGIAEALWPEGRPASWVKVIQGCVSRLRSTFGAETIETCRNGYRLAPEAIELDRDEFERLVEQGRRHLATRVPERAVFVLQQALDLWRGDPLAELDEWLPGHLEAARLNELRLAAEEDLLQARLDAGNHLQVAAEGMVLVGEEPWRERRWELLALSQYRSGRQADALATIRTARRTLGRELGLDPGSGLVELERAILAQDPSLAADHSARSIGGSCPWQGLASYDAEHRDTFFGRSEDVDACLRRLDESPLLGLVGPSGSGKSSLMKAGLAPALRVQGREVVTLTPGADPQAALTTAQVSASAHPVLCVDQFEEAFVGTASRERVGRWLAELAAYAVQRAPVVFTMRSDFVSDLSLDPGFAALVERGLHLVAPLSGDALRAIIEGPAQVAGLRLEPGLVDLLLRDAADQPGALPLLSHALAETWQRREGSALTVDGYHASGGISGAVAASADRLHASLSDTGRGHLRWLMLRMGSLAEHGEPVRTPVPHEVANDDGERARVLDALVRARLVTSADGAYELAHEALVRAWPRLRRWLEEDREGQRLWRHLATAAEEWRRLGRPDSELYTGVRLAAAREWASREGSQPTQLEREFLDASLEHARVEREEWEQRARHERRQNRRLRGLLAGVGVLLVCALVATLLAVEQGRTAAAERDSARNSRALALHESLVSRSLTLRATNRAAAALLAVEAWRSRADPLAESALLGTFTDAPGFLGYRTTPYEIVQGAAIPGTNRAVIANGSRIHVVDLDTGELGPLFEQPMQENDNQQVLRVSGDGRRLAQLLFDPARNDDGCGTYELLRDNDGRGCTLLTVYDIATGQALFGPVPTPFQGGDLAIDHSGRLVAAAGGFDGDLATYDVERSRRLGILPGLPRPPAAPNWRDTAAVAFDRHGLVYLGSLRGPVRAVDPRSLEIVRTYPAPPMSTHNFLAVTPDGRLVGTGDDHIVAIRRDSARTEWIADLGEDTDPWPCPTAAIAPRMHRLYCGSFFGEIAERNLDTGQLTGINRDPQLGEVGDLSVAHGNELVAFSHGYYRWRIDGTGPVARMVARDAVSLAGYDSSGRLLDLVPGGDFGPHRIVVASTGEQVARFAGEADAVWVGSNALGLFGEGGLRLGAVDRRVRSQPVGGPIRRAEWVYPASDPRLAWAVPSRGGPRGFVLREFDVSSGSRTGRVVHVPGFVRQVHSTDGGNTLLVTYITQGSYLSWGWRNNFRTALFEVDGGHTTDVVSYQSAVAGTADGVGTVVIADPYGQISEHDPDTLQPTAVLPGSKGSVLWMGFSDDGSRLLATGVNNSVQLYATRDWTRIGSIPAEARGEVREAFLRPDGQAVAANGRLGVVEWDLDPERMAGAACGLAGRNLTRAEWTTYMGDQPYRRTCPEFPAGA